MSNRRTAVYRARQRAGVAVLNVPVPLHDLLAALIEAGRVTPAAAFDRREVERAAGEVLWQWSREWLQKV